MNSEYDVVVIGGGPAGSTVSTLIADSGFRVGLFERERFPRFHIGESLIPETYWVLKRTGMLPKMQQQPLRQEIQRAVRERERQAVGAVLLSRQQAARVLADLAGRSKRVRSDDARECPRTRRGRARGRARARGALRRRSSRGRGDQRRRWRTPRNPCEGRGRRQRAGCTPAEQVQAACLGSRS